jgi:hypothetical protein
MSGADEAALQLQQFLLQVAAKAPSSHTINNVQAVKQQSSRQAVLQAQQAAKSSIEVLLQV